MMSKKGRPATASTAVSGKTDSTLDRLVSGPMMYSGPGGFRNHVVKHLGQDFIGIGPYSPERTGNALYLLHPAKKTPFPKSKLSGPGCIGWGLPTSSDPRSWPVHLNISTKEELRLSDENCRIIFGGMTRPEI